MSSGKKKLKAVKIIPMLYRFKDNMRETMNMIMSARAMHLYTDQATASIS